MERHAHLLGSAVEHVLTGVRRMSAPTLSRVIFLPTEVTSRIFGLLANLGSNGAFEFISRKMWAVGHGAFLLGWIAVAGFCTVVALQSTQSVLAAII